MKEIAAIFKKPIVVIALGLVVTLVIAGLIGFFFVLPQFNALDENQKKTADLSVKLADLTKNINAIKNIDQEEIDGYSKTLASFFPENTDYLHFATLNDRLVSAAGLKITSFTISSATRVSLPAATASGSTGGTPATAKQPPATSTTTDSIAGSGYTVVVSYTGSFDRVENFLKNLRGLDRAVAVGQVLFNSTVANLSTNITFFLPLSASVSASASSDNLVTLSASDKVLLNNLAKSVEFTATPAENTLGKSNPFQ